MTSSLVAIATCAEVAGEDNDDLHVIEALRRRGIEAVHAVWDDSGVDWSQFALVVVRSTWDYSDRCEQFLDWAARLPRVLNPLPVLRWNTDKRYLNDLARAGLPVIPTTFLEPGEAFNPPSHPFVVKPTVSCGAKNTAWYAAEDAAEARVHVRQIQDLGRTVMIQPYLSSIESTGEVSLMFIDGQYSHSICRSASLKHSGLREEDLDIPLSVDVYEDVRAYVASPEELPLAERIMSHIQRLWSKLLYARVDLVSGPRGEPIILEIELTEPTLFLKKHSEDGVERLANGIANALNFGP
jgi:hypothetical protein